jgi:uncharacterized membrane protein
MMGATLKLDIRSLQRMWPMSNDSQENAMTTGSAITKRTDAPPGKRRLLTLDVLRGLFIALMALDHANFFVAQQHSSGEYWGGPFPAYDSAALFLARLVTHPAAPGFLFLMGVGMALFAQSRQKAGWTRWAVVRHFLVRGALLIAIQLLIVNRAWELSPQGWHLRWYFGVLVALGGGMILGSILVWLKPWCLILTGLVLMISMEVATPSPDRWGTVSLLAVNLLLVPGGAGKVWVNYPILQWLELVVVGLAFGLWLAADSKRAYRRALALGGLCLSGFFVLRLVNGFGNIRPRLGTSWIDWLNLVKYPPSITFTLFTLGVTLFVLWLLSLTGGRMRQGLAPIAVFGRTPLLFYVLHLFLYAALAHAFAPTGTSLAIMLGFWIAGLLILYPLCLKFGQFKDRQSPDSVLRYL